MTFLVSTNPIVTISGTIPIATTEGATPVISIQDSTINQKGAVQLEDSFTSTSIVKAATPNSVKEVYEYATTVSSTLQTDVDSKASTLLELSDTPNVYEEGEYLRSTTSGVEWAFSEAQALVIKGKEENISAITKGQVCAIMGSSGSKAEIGLCECDVSDRIRIMGLAQIDIPQNEDGTIVYKGFITGVDTRTTNSDVNPNGETWVSGELLWVSVTPGGMTKSRPISGRSIKAARTVKGNSTTDTLIVISHENEVWSTAAAGENVVLRVGDSAGANKVSIRDYENNEVGAVDSNGNLTVVSIDCGEF